MASSDSGLWDYSDPANGLDLTGYSVEATDGGIGKVDEATNEVGSSYIVVDTGPWIFGKKRMLPAGVIDRVDRDDEKVYVNRKKDEIKDAPEFDDTMSPDDGYRDEVGTYYGGQGTTGVRGPRDIDPV